MSPIIQRAGGVTSAGKQAGTIRSTPAQIVGRSVAGPAQFITMTGRLGSTAVAGFTVLCGPNPPTQTDGWAQWTIVGRPRQVGVTINAGYNPIAMDVQLRFEAWTADYNDRIAKRPNRAAQVLEDQIHTLIWMTGRGRLYAQNGVVGEAALGDPPIITVYSADTQGHQRPLIPPDFQNMSWVISALSWDQSPIRNVDGYRVRQDVTVSLLQFVQDVFSAGTASSSGRAKSSTTKYTQVQTTATMNTIQQVANVVANDATAASAILQANKDVKGIGTSARKKLPPGTRVKVPTAKIQPKVPASDPGAGNYGPSPIGTIVPTKPGSFLPVGG